MERDVVVWVRISELLRGLVVCVCDAIEMWEGVGVWSWIGGWGGSLWMA